MQPSDIISLDEDAIEHKGWTDFDDYKPITNHVNLQAFSKEQFISRCKKLNILLVENLKEKSFRKIIDYLGFAKSDTEKLRALKLLELFVKYLYVANSAGLNPIQDKEAIVERTNEVKDLNLISELFALNSIRQLDAHKSGDFKSKFHVALKILAIEPNSISNNYADACDQVYDKVDSMFIEINSFLVDLLDSIST